MALILRSGVVVVFAYEAEQGTSFSFSYFPQRRELSWSSPGTSFERKRENSQAVLPSCFLGQFFINNLAIEKKNELIVVIFIPFFL